MIAGTHKQLLFANDTDGNFLVFQMSLAAARCTRRSQKSANFC